MTTLQNPFEFGAALARAPDDAAVSEPQMPSAETAAEILDLGTDCIAEIFAGAAKLEPVEIWFENTAYPREDELLYEVLEAQNDTRLPGLDEPPYGFAWALDEPPLFLRQAG